MPEGDLQQLSTLLRRRRAQARLTVRQLAEQAGLVPSTVSRLESGLIAEPRPGHLQRLAGPLGLDVEDLYACAGYATSGELPELAPYLRRKYGLPDDAIRRIEADFKATRDHVLHRKEERHDNTPGDQAP